VEEIKAIKKKSAPAGHRGRVRQSVRAPR